MIDNETGKRQEAAIVQPLLNIPIPGDGLPSGLIDYLIKLLTDGPDD